MDIQSRCPQCSSARKIEITPSNVGNTIDFSKARCNSYGYRYGEDWTDMIQSRKSAQFWDKDAEQARGYFTLIQLEKTLGNEKW